MVLRRARGWARLGAAQLGLGHYQAALAAYKKGLRLQPGAPDMELGLQEVGELAQSRSGRRDAVHHE
jgi:stress-induced-phosphoprotein 1